METSGRLHAPAAFPASKGTRYPLNKIGGPQKPGWTFRMTEKSLAPTGIQIPIKIS